MKTRLHYLFFVLLMMSLLAYLSGCEGCRNVAKKRTLNASHPCDTINSVVTVNLNAVAFLTPHTGFAVGDSGVIIKTTNGGYNWTRVGAGITGSNLYGVGVATPSTVVAVGEIGTIVLSTTGGASWSVISSGNVEFLQSLRTVAFYAPLNGHAAGDSGVIFSTTDGGFSWTKVYGDPLQTYYGLSHNAAGVPFLVGNKGKILKTTAWDSITGVTTKNLKSIHFALASGPITHSDTGFAVGDSGVIIKTTNGGDNWSVDTAFPTKYLRGVFLTSPHWGYAVGENGAVLRYNGTGWVLLPVATTKNLNGVDPWGPTSTCVGEDGAIYLENPPLVTNGSTVDPNTSDCQTWTFGHDFILTEDAPGGGTINYYNFEVCSSIEVNWGRTSLTGWAVRDNFYGRSDNLGATGPPPPGTYEYVLSSSGNCIVSCYLIDQSGNPHTLSSYDCTP